MLSFLMILFASCSKDHKDATSSAIQGTYKLKYITVKNNGTLTSLNQKTVNVAQYTTINNGGTLVIDASKVTATSLTYEVNSTQTSYIYTDRPIYRPAQTVFFKGILRQWTSNGYKLIDSKNVNVTIEDPNNGKVFEKELPLSDHGTFSGQLDVGDEAPLGAEGNLIGAIDVPDEATSVKVNVRDSAGQLVRTLTLPADSSGVTPFSWDGVAEDGTRAPAGTYKLEAIASAGGKSASLETLLAGHVSSVTIDASNGLSLNTSNLGTFSLSQVRRVM